MAATGAETMWDAHEGGAVSFPGQDVIHIAELNSTEVKKRSFLGKPAMSSINNDQNQQDLPTSAANAILEGKPD